LSTARISNAEQTQKKKVWGKRYTSFHLVKKTFLNFLLSWKVFKVQKQDYKTTYSLISCSISVTGDLKTKNHRGAVENENEIQCGGTYGLKQGLTENKNDGWHKLSAVQLQVLTVK